jgi:hypothetical protein
VRRTDHSSTGVLLTVARRVCDLENLVNEEAIARVGLQRHEKMNNYYIISLVIKHKPISALHNADEQNWENVSSFISSLMGLNFEVKYSYT